MNYADFVKSRQWTEDLDSDSYEGRTPGYRYGGQRHWCVALDTGSAEWHTILYNDQQVSGDIRVVERRLYEAVAAEMNWRKHVVEITLEYKELANDHEEMLKRLRSLLDFDVFGPKTLVIEYRGTKP